MDIFNRCCEIHRHSDEHRIRICTNTLSWHNVLIIQNIGNNVSAIFYGLHQVAQMKIVEKIATVKCQTLVIFSGLLGVASQYIFNGQLLGSAPELELRYHAIPDT